MTHKKKWDRPRIDHKNRLVLGHAPVERLDFVLTAGSTEQFYVNDSWRAFPEGFKLSFKNVHVESWGLTEEIFD